MVSLLSNEKAILGRWTEYFKNLLNTVTITPLDRRRSVHFEEENANIASEILLAAKTLKAEKATGQWRSQSNNLGGQNA